MTNDEDEDRGTRDGEIPPGIANLGIIIGAPEVGPPANDNQAKPEPQAIGSSGNCDEASSDP
jgi:hypothetical protein